MTNLSKQNSKVYSNKSRIFDASIKVPHGQASVQSTRPLEKEEAKPHWHDGGIMQTISIMVSALLMLAGMITAPFLMQQSGADKAKSGTIQNSEETNVIPFQP